MPIFDIFSKRQQKLRGEVPDTYVYDKLPQSLRGQIVHIWRDTLGILEVWKDFDGCHRTNNPEIESAYQYIVEALCREYGVFWLPGVKRHGGIRNYMTELNTYLFHENEIDKVLNAVQLSFQVIDAITRNLNYQRLKDASKRADDAIEELNYRFKEHGVGYQFTNREIIRNDSEFAHDEIVKPALTLLQGKQYRGAQDEFLNAHKHYRERNAKEALNECLKAFESVMKAICEKRHWPYSPTATAKPLIQICFDKGLIDQFWQSNFSALQSLLESSVPTGRNRLGGHGQGTNPVSVPNHIVAYMLHMTASAIVFLAEAEKQLP